MKKFYNEDSKVGVIVSPGLGGCWSRATSNKADQIFLSMDEQLVMLKLRKANYFDACDYFENKLKGFEQPGQMGWDQATVQWLDKGTEFVIRHYDGEEDIMLLGDLGICVA